MRFVFRKFLVALLAVFAMSAMAASAASAIGFDWKVNGTKLEAGTSANFDLKASKSFVLKMSNSGALSEVKCSKVKVYGEGAKISGGIPGRGSVSPQFEGCKVEKPKGCTFSTGETFPWPQLEAEIVEGAGVSAGKVELLVRNNPQEGTLLTFEFINKGAEKCPLNNSYIAVVGSILIETNPQKEEREKIGLVFVVPPKETRSKYKNWKGEEKTAGMEHGGEPVTFSGEAEMELASKEKFGPF